MVEAADLFTYMASAAQVGLEWIDGQYVDTANRAAAADPSQPPPVRPSSAGGRGGGDGGGSTSPAPFVAGLREAGAAVQHGFAEATDAVVSAPLGQLETWQPGSAEVPPVIATIIRGVPVRARPPASSLTRCRRCCALPRCPCAEHYGAFSSSIESLAWRLALADRSSLWGLSWRVLSGGDTAADDRGHGGGERD